MDGKHNILYENKLESNIYDIECLTRLTSPRSNLISTTSDASNLSTLYTSDGPGLSTTTITSPKILPIDPRLRQDCNSSSLDSYESETTKHRDLNGPDPTTSPTSSMPNNGSSSPQEALPGADTTSLTTASREKAHRKNPRDNDGVRTTQRLTRSMARRQAKEGQRGHNPCSRSAKEGSHLSKEENSLLRNMAKAGSNLQEAIQKFQMSFPNRSKALIRRQWYLMQSSPRITRSTRRIYMRR